MPDFAELFTENPTYFVLLFCGVLLLFLLGFIISKVVTGRKKKVLRNAGNMAELEFDQMARAASKFVTDVQFMGYKIFSVNGAEPSVVGKSIFTPAGTCRIELQYIDTNYATRRASTTTVHEKQLLEFEVRGNEKYRISFDEKSGSYVVR